MYVQKSLYENLTTVLLCLKGLKTLIVENNKKSAFIGVKNSFSL
jgi:hypothetical protein